MISKTKKYSGGEMPLLSNSTKTNILARLKNEEFDRAGINDIMKRLKYEYQGLSFLHHTSPFKPLNKGGRRKRSKKKRTTRKKYRRSIKKRLKKKRNS